MYAGGARIHITCLPVVMVVPRQVALVGTPSGVGWHAKWRWLARQVALVGTPSGAPVALYIVKR